MSRRFGCDSETDSLFIALVDELATGLFPAAIMAATYCGVASFVAFRVQSSVLWVIAGTGTLIGASKCLLKRRHPCARQDRPWDRQRAAWWEGANAVFTWGFAVLIGCVAACGFLAVDPALPVLVTGLVFGYCSGTVTRIAFRPRIAGIAICIATVPAILALASRGDSNSIPITTVFTAFLCGGLETIRYLYLNTRRQIILRHDMATLAKNDPLTRLLNRLGLREAYRGVLAEARGNAIAVHCLDLDGLKPVNDQYGHAAGDELLQVIADRLRAVAHGKAAVALVGRDEFVIVQGPILKPDEAAHLAERIDHTIAEPYQIQGRKGPRRDQHWFCDRTAGLARTRSAHGCSRCRAVPRQGEQARRDGSASGRTGGQRPSGREREASNLSRPCTGRATAPPLDHASPAYSARPRKSDWMMRLDQKLGPMRNLLGVVSKRRF